MQPTPNVQPDVTGDLRRYPLPRLLFYLCKRAFVGRLDISLPREIAASVYFQGGLPAHVQANLPEDYLGSVLLEQGWIDSAQYNQSLVLLSQGGKRHGQILRDLGYIDDEVLVAGLQLQLRRKLNRLFFAEDAPFALYAGEHSVGENAETRTVRADPLWVIHQGVRNAFGSARLEAELAKLRGAAVNLRADFGQVSHRFGLDEQQLGLAQLLMRSVVPFAQLRQVSPLAPVETDMLIYLFWVTEVLTVVAATGAQAAGRASATGSGFAAVGEPVPLTALASSPDVASSGEFTVESSLQIAGDIADALGDFGGDQLQQHGPVVPRAVVPPARQSRPAVAAVAPQAAPEEPLRGFGATVAASTRASRRRPMANPMASASNPMASASNPMASASSPVAASAPGRQSAGRSSQPRISDQDAEVLRQDIKRYHAELDQRSHYEALGVVRRSSPGEARDAYFALAKRFHPDRLAGLGLADVAAEAEEVFRRINEAHSVLTDLKLRAEYDKSLDGGGSDEADEARALIEAEMTFQRGTVAYRKRDYVGALAHFEEACRLNPKEGEHLAWRAWTRFSDPKLDNGKVLPELRKELYAAIKCSPKSAISHYYLGEIHLAMGDDKKAIASFNKTIELKPTDVDALRQLRLIRLRHERGKKGGVSGLLKKFRKK